MKPGDIGLLRITGVVGLGIRVGQWATGDGFEDYEHAVICTQVQSGEATVMEARPGGAGTARYLDSPVLWLRPAEELNYTQQQAVVAAAYSRIGTPYSFLDYDALALHRFNIPAPGLRRYIESTQHMICSQLVDWCYQMAGIELFDDGRWNGYVTPGDIYGLYATGKLVKA
jgi:cell wall-associated NlpC family hydrolase